MSVLGQVASAQDRGDERPNIVLAEKIVKSSDKNAITELVSHVNDKDAAIPNDCIKVLYEIGERKPQLIAPHLEVFVALLNHKNNRLQWGAMTALHCVVKVRPKGVAAHLPTILRAAEMGSVITRDYAVNILIELTKQTKLAAAAWKPLVTQLRDCPPNQLGMYTERIMAVAGPRQKPLMAKILQSRLKELKKASQRNRVEKLLKKIS